MLWLNSFSTIPFTSMITFSIIASMNLLLQLKYVLLAITLLFLTETIMIAKYKKAKVINFFE